jgi:hypothetical protein
MIFHWASVSVVRIKVASHLATSNHSMPDLGILKRQQALLRLLKQPEDLLFGYWKYLVTDFAADAAMMAADPKTQGF